MLNADGVAPTAIITGATSGIGYASAEELARSGYRVVLTGRNEEKGAARLTQLRRAVPGADVSYQLLDLSSLRAIEEFTASWHGPVTLLINNGAVMGMPKRRVSRNGLEAQFATNYLSHFALSLRLLPALLQAPGARVVSVASLAHRNARINFDDLQSEQRYSPYGAYAQSKLAMLMFARAFQKRIDAHGWDLRSIAAHPGWSATGIVGGMGTSLWARLADVSFRFAAQSAENGARPILFSALDPAAEPGGYYGPSRLGETRGPTAPSRVMPQADDEDAANRLWDVSEQLTGVSFEEIAGPKG